MLNAIAFIHWGASDYRDCALEQALKRNPNTNIILISDIPYTKTNGLIRNVDLSDFTHSTEQLRPFFANYSSNDADYEYKCFARWFVLRDVCVQYGIGTVFYADSDVLIYDNLNLILKKIGAIRFSVSHGCCGHSSYWTIDALNEFCDYIMKLYQADKERISDWYSRYKSAGHPGGFNDMSALAEFSQNSEIPGYEITTVLDGFTFDHNANMSQNGQENFMMKNGAKELFWINDHPYGKTLETDKLIRFAALHFQGFAKTQIPDVYRGRLQIYNS